MFSFSNLKSTDSSLVALLLVLGTSRLAQGFVSPSQDIRHSFSLLHSNRRTMNTKTSLYAETKTLEVCLSPGCVADGAETALLKLKSLCSRTDMDITQGVCCSLCGNGPVARDPVSGKKHRKITTNKKIVDLLEIENLDPNQEAVLEGIDLCLQGHQELKRKNYKGAAQHYAKAIETGMAAAIALGSNDDNSIVALEWVIQALCNEGICKLKTADVDGAIVSAGTAYQLSLKTSSDSLEVLQEAYGAKKEARKELEALQALFILYEQQEEAQKGLKPARRKRITPMEANKRRTLGFRLSQLEATVKT